MDCACELFTVNPVIESAGTLRVPWGHEKDKAHIYNATRLWPQNATAAGPHRSDRQPRSRSYGRKRAVRENQAHPPVRPKSGVCGACLGRGREKVRRLKRLV